MELVLLEVVCTIQGLVVGAHFQEQEPNLKSWYRLSLVHTISLGKPSKEKNGNILVFYQSGVPPPLPPLARIGNFRFFPRLFSQGGVVIIGKKIIPFLHVSEHIDHF